MKKAILLFGLVGGLVIPIAFTALGWALRGWVPDSAAALAGLHDVQLPLWPMSKLIIDDPAGRHWLYLPLAAILSNALIYVAVGALSVWGRTKRLAFTAAIAVAAGFLLAAQQGFGTGVAGFAVAAGIAIVGLALHHFGQDPT